MSLFLNNPHGQGLKGYLQVIKPKPNEKLTKIVVGQTTDMDKFFTYDLNKEELQELVDYLNAILEKAH
jgi:hypothetical protein